MALLLAGTQVVPLAPVATAQEATPSAATTLKLVVHALHLTDVDHGDPGPLVGDVQLWGPNL